MSVSVFLAEKTVVWYQCKHTLGSAVTFYALNQSVVVNVDTEAGQNN